MQVKPTIINIECNECNSQDSRTLLFGPDGIHSRCLNCGFQEWEWAWSDSADYLDYLADRHKTSRANLERLLEQFREGPF